MRTSRRQRVDATILGAASLLALAVGPGVPVTNTHAPGAQSVAGSGIAAADLVGGWISSDRTVRLNLGADGRYDRSLVGRTRAARGTYSVDGTGLLLRDDSGIRTVVTVHADVLELAGHRLLRR